MFHVSWSARDQWPPPTVSTERAGAGVRGFGNNVNLQREGISIGGVLDHRGDTRAVHSTGWESNRSPDPSRRPTGHDRCPSDQRQTSDSLQVCIRPLSMARSRSAPSTDLTRDLWPYRGWRHRFYSTMYLIRRSLGSIPATRRRDVADPGPWRSCLTTLRR